MHAGIYLLLFIVVHLCAPAICADQQLVIDPNDPELEILREFYYATGGQNWTQQSNWLNISVSKCFWFGLRCGGSNGGPAIFYIGLPSNNLQGTLPESLANLTILQQAYLSSNALTGTLPHFITRMPNLSYLDLNSNQFTGTIPEEYGSMTQLHGLYLFNNMIHGTIPSSLGSMTRLNFLHLFSNRLTGTIPAELGQLSRLELLALSRNNLTGTIPESLGQLTAIRQFQLFENQLTGTIPDSIFRNLANVTVLYLFGNRLSGTIPDSIQNLVSLENLYLHDNQLNGTIPATVGQLSQLRQLLLYNNQLTGTIPTTISNPPLLDTFTVDSNSLSGTIPLQLFQARNLVWLGLADNYFYGTISSHVGTLSNLRTLLMQDNQLSGVIPDSVGFLSRLTQLNLGNNQLSGSIPATIATMRALEFFYVGKNHLTGTIPSSFGELQNLVGLVLLDNNLMGTIPETIGILTRLTVFAVARNQLTGTIPRELGNLRGLQSLFLHNNQLTGTIHEEIYAIPLRSMSFAHNQLQGTISPKLATSRVLTEFSAAFNRLTGTLPSLSSVTSLQRFNVESNFLYGCLSLPERFTHETASQTCNVGDNLFCCSQRPYVCSTELNCPRSSSLVVPSGSVVTFDNSSALSNFVLEEGGVLLMKPLDVINVQCLTLKGEIQIDVSEDHSNVIPNLNILSSRCGSIDSSQLKVTAGNPLCTVHHQINGNSIQASVSCTAPEASVYPLVLGIVIPLGTLLIAGAVVLTIFIIRRRKRIEGLKSRVEMLTLSSANVDKASSPPEDFTFKLLEDMPIKLSKANFKFGTRGNLLVVDQVATDSFNIQSLGKSSSKSKKYGSLYDKLLLNRTVVQLRPVNSSKYRLSFDPQVFEIPHDMSVDVNIRLTLTMTTKTKVSFWIELPEDNMYTLIEFDAASEPSSWVDVDEVKPEYPAIGEGGFGAVFRAIYKGQIVAYKTLKMQDMEADYYREFEQEVRMMMNLHHKGVLQFIGASRVPGKLAILTEFMSQGSLQKLVEGPPIDFGLKVKIIKDIAEALEYLHSNNILHRDIKAENVLVVSTSKDAIVNVKLADFGTARSATEQVTSKFTKGVGTPVYMAVEILKNEKYERSADVYSFAILMWAVVEQKQPYADFKYAWDVADFVIQGKRLPIPDTCPKVLQDLISQCWAQNPDDRPLMSEVVKKLSELK